MKGAKEYNKLLQRAAEYERAGFKFEGYNKIRNGNFMFILGKHVMGETLNVYLLKDLNPKIFRFFPSIYLKPQNALHVYGPIEGRVELNERYDFLVDGMIKEKLWGLFDDAIDVWYEVEGKMNKEKEDEKDRREKEKRKRIEEFEKIFTGKYKENNVEELEDDDIDNVDYEDEIEFDDIDDEDDVIEEIVSEEDEEDEEGFNEYEEFDEDAFDDNENFKDENIEDELMRNGI